MNSHGNVEIEIHVFLTTVLGEGEWLFSPSDSSFSLSMSLVRLEIGGSRVGISCFKSKKPGTY